MIGNMKRRYKIYLIIFIIQFVFLFFNSSYAKVSTSLSEFVNKNGIENMTNKELETKRAEILKKLEDINKTTASTISMNVSTILNSADMYQNYNQKMKFLEEEFSTQANYAKDETALDYLYYGYMLGQKWVIYKENSEEAKKEDSEGKTVAQQFDEKYKEYQKLKEEEKDIATLIKYQDSLRTLYEKLPKEDVTKKRTEQMSEVESAVDKKDDSAMDTPDIIYQYPTKNESTSASSLDDMMGDADKFIDSAENAAISSSSLQDFSKTFYNILLTVGIVVAVLVGSILGIKFMMGGAEEKANVKELLVPYIVGCIVIFGAFAIWKIVVTILSSTVS